MGMQGPSYNSEKGLEQAGLEAGKPRVAGLFRVCGPKKVTAVRRGWGLAREIEPSPEGNREPRTSRARERSPPASWGCGGVGKAGSTGCHQGRGAAQPALCMACI